MSEIYSTIVPPGATSGSSATSFSPQPAETSATTRSHSVVLQDIVENELQVRRSQARQVRLLAELTAQTTPARRGRSPKSIASEGSSTISSQTLVAALVAPEMTWSRQWARRVVNTSVELPRDLPDIMALFEAGSLDEARARLISDSLHNPPLGLEWLRPGCPEWLVLQAALAHHAPSTSYAALAKLINQLLLGLRPDEANAAHARAKSARRVRISLAETVGATTTALVVSPTTALALSTIKTSSDSNVPLLGTDATRAGDRRILGVPILVSPYVDDDTIWGIDATRVYFVLRKDVEVTTDRSVFYTSDRVAVRAILRVGFGFVHEQSIIRITTRT